MENGKGGDFQETAGWLHPPVDIMLDLFKRLEEDGTLSLQWKNPGKKASADGKVRKLKLPAVSKKTKTAKVDAQTLSAFDFDELEQLEAATPATVVKQAKIFQPARATTTHVGSFAAVVKRFRQQEETVTANEPAKKKLKPSFFGASTENK